MYRAMHTIQGIKNSVRVPRDRLDFYLEETMKIVRDSKSSGKVPRLDGGHASHFIGHVCQGEFESQGVLNGIEFTKTPFKDSYVGFTDLIDFETGGFSVDVKGSYCNPLNPNLNFLIPVSQVNYSNTNIYVSCSLEISYQLNGFVWKEDLKKAKIREDLPLKAYTIPFNKLRDTKELWGVLG